jgi:uncharacterized protein
MDLTILKPSMRMSSAPSISRALKRLVLTSGFVLSAGFHPVLCAENPILCQGYYQTEAQAKAQLDSFAAQYRNARQWKNRAAQIRSAILRGAGLSPFPEKTPLHAVMPGPGGRRAHDGYSVENVAFESVPGFWVTGNLYRPAPEGRKPPYAGVLCPHGHFKIQNAPGGGRFNDDMQIRCAMLARMGAVVFAWDMVGTGESNMAEHKVPHALMFQLWNSIRSLDFLLSLKTDAGKRLVDKRRVGITGASGGGTQTFLLTAVDPRITASAPVVMVSAHFFGGCACESGMPVHKSDTHETNNADIAALAAPRPMLLMSDGADWTKNNPEVEFPYIQRVYRLTGAEKNVRLSHFPGEGHDYGPSKRAALVPFFAEHLRLDLQAVLDSTGRVNESCCTVEPAEAMRVFKESGPGAAPAVKTDAEICAIFRRLQDNP